MQMHLPFGLCQLTLKTILLVTQQFPSEECLGVVARYLNDGAIFPTTNIHFYFFTFFRFFFFPVHLSIHMYIYIYIYRYIYIYTLHNHSINTSISTVHCPKKGRLCPIAREVHTPSAAAGRKRKPLCKRCRGRAGGMGADFHKKTWMS